MGYLGNVNPLLGVTTVGKLTAKLADVEDTIRSRFVLSSCYHRGFILVYLNAFSDLVLFMGWFVTAQR